MTVGVGDMRKARLLTELAEYERDARKQMKILTEAKIEIEARINDCMRRIPLTHEEEF